MVWVSSPKIASLWNALSRQPAVATFLPHEHIDSSFFPVRSRKVWSLGLVKVFSNAWFFIRSSLCTRRALIAMDCLNYHATAVLNTSSKNCYKDTCVSERMFGRMKSARRKGSRITRRGVCIYILRNRGRKKVGRNVYTFHDRRDH